MACNLKRLIITPLDNGVSSLQCDSFCAMYNTKNKHIVGHEVINGLSYPVYHPYKNPEEFKINFLYRFKPTKKNYTNRIKFS